jgi:hypothetical protein
MDRAERGKDKAMYVEGGEKRPAEWKKGETAR